MDHLPQFYSVHSDASATCVFPRIDCLVKGFGQTYFCQAEKRSLFYASGDMTAVLEPNKGTQWPDILGCGPYPFFIVSARVVEAWERERLGEFPRHEVIIAAPLPKGFAAEGVPKYYWIDGSRLRGALTDFEASGFVGVRFCPECGTCSDDISETFDRQYACGARFAFVFRRDSWTGLNLFTTDISDAQFFCTEAVVDCARRCRFTNFKFVAIEEGFGNS